MRSVDGGAVMKTKTIVMAAGVLVAALLLAVACGGDGDGGNGDEAGIRTQKGLGVAALAAAADRGDESTNGEDSQDGAAPGAPSADTGTGGVAYPDIAPFPYYPSLQGSQTGITVQGFGSATVKADSAILDFYFSTKGTGIEPLPGRDGSEPGSTGSSGTGVAPPPDSPQSETASQTKPITVA